MTNRDYATGFIQGVESTYPGVWRKHILASLALQGSTTLTEVERGFIDGQMTKCGPGTNKFYARLREVGVEFMDEHEHKGRTVKV